MKNKNLLVLLKQNKLFRVVVIISSALITFGGIYAGINAFSDVGKNIFKSIKKSDEQLAIEKLSTDMSDEFFESILGKPLVRIKNSEELSDYRTDVYKTENTIISALVDKDNIVISYSVVIRSKKIRFELPFRIRSLDDINFNKPLYLGNVYFSTIPDKPQSIWYGLSSKFITYTESFYFGNLGDYKVFLLGYNPNGVDFMNEDEHHHFVNVIITTKRFDYQKKTSEYERIFQSEDRKYLKPNAFGVISASASKAITELISTGDVGIDWSCAKGLNLCGPIE